MNYIKQKIGLLNFGNNLIDEYAVPFVDMYSVVRAHRMRKHITKDYNHVCIFGMFPVPLAFSFDCEVTIIDDSAMLEHFSGQLKSISNIRTVIKNPLFEDMQPYIDCHDLIVYHDSEYLVPLELMKHHHNEKDVFIMNTFDTQKHCKNYVYSKNDLLDVYPMKELYSAGTTHFYNEVYTFHSYGKIDD